MRAKNILALLIGVGILWLTGCTTKSIESLGSGYEEVTYTQPRIFMEQDAHRFALQYRKPNGGKVLIWSSVPSGPDITNDIAVFVADTARESRDPNQPQAMMRRLFAVKSPEMPLDITDEVLWQWSMKTGIDFAEALKIASIVSLSEKGSQLEIRFAFWNNNDWPRLVTLDWNHIPDIMGEVRAKGFVRKDRIWGTSYIENEFKPEVQK